jgi:hypothetical protein
MHPDGFYAMALGQAERQAMTDPPPREGFYWISRGRGDPEVAQWDGEFWWRTGTEVPIHHDDWIEILSERLRPED